MNKILYAYDFINFLQLIKIHIKIKSKNYFETFSSYIYIKKKKK
jgi:hypothetical protein